jgi:hypothetical protein
MESVHPDLVVVALERVSGTDFEKFIHEFYPGLVGEAFVPLGGVRDGGADAFQTSDVWMSPGAKWFYQASTEEDVAGKIATTVRRLREFGRTPELLTYITNRVVKHADIEEERLARQLNVAVRIRDSRFIANNINQSPQTVSAYRNHLEHLTSYLAKPGASDLLRPSAVVTSPAIYVFLRQEVERRTDDISLLDAVIDSLALWALEGTDPDKDVLLDRDEVLAKITAEIPSASQLIGLRVGKRLEAMSKKTYSGGRAVRWHRKRDGFCLPYETRSTIERDNLDDELLRIRMTDAMSDRIRDSFSSPVDLADIKTATGVALRAVQLAYEREGLEFSRFLESRDSGDDFPTIADHIRDAFDELAPNHKNRLAMTDSIFRALRASLYTSLEDERLYFGRLSRTYALLFLLRTEPGLVHFFQRMAGDFYLYVGADQIIRAISERYLPEPDQMTRTMFKMARAAGSKLVLSEPVLDEVVGHLRATDVEYRENEYSRLEPHMTVEIARNIPKILIRAYLYAKLDPSTHDGYANSWESYVAQFCDYGDLRKPRGSDQVKNYLLGQFGMKFETNNSIQGLIEPTELGDLAGALTVVKEGNAQLARHDAVLTLAVYARRERNKELAESSVFGHRTWWLTDEARILPATRKVIAKHGSAPYMMRPDFLLNFIALSPSTAAVRKTFRNIFPSLLGIRMARRMDEAAFHGLLGMVKDWDVWEEGRRIAVIAKLSDQLIADFRKRYAITLKTPALRQ